MKNPNYVAAVAGALGRSKAGDKKRLAGLVAKWDARQAEIGTHALADAFADGLTAAEVAAIQAAYPRGLGDYVEELLG